MMHLLGVIHRDLIPGNILYKKLDDNTIKLGIIDFGSAVETTDKKSRDIDWQFTYELINQIQKHRASNPFYARVSRTEFIPYAGAIQFTRDGKECSDWI